MKNILMAIIAAALTGCGATVPKANYDELLLKNVELSAEVKDLAPTQEEIDYVNRTNEEVPAFQKFLEKWSWKFGAFVSQEAKAKTKVKIEGYVFSSNFDSALVTGLVVNEKFSHRAHAMMIKKDGVWHHGYVIPGALIAGSLGEDNE